MRCATLLALILTSCSSHCTPCWSARKTVTHSKKYNSSKIIFPICNTFSEMEVEITTTISGTRVYGNIYSLPLKDHSINAFIEISGISTEAQIDIFEGGQKVLFSQSTANQIISALEQGNEVSLSVGRYKSHLTAKNFQKAFCSP